MWIHESEPDSIFYVTLEMYQTLLGTNFYDKALTGKEFSKYNLQNLEVVESQKDPLKFDLIQT